MYIRPQQRLMARCDAVGRITPVIPIIDPVNVLIPVSASGRRHLHIDQDHICVGQLLIGAPDLLLIVPAQHNILIRKDTDIRIRVQQRRVAA